ncbi:hypothetical protein PIROE2DRAFT_11118 [Piromyces sp. E2]|nr:hypothetical protein PIROE2DRAFT_11118 [Piromyces sp. E2]|eukprot:OUM62540.1 hypothetical protein PIROE2DRAFT_11118 [Piromyces sp. E2]
MWGKRTYLFHVENFINDVDNEKYVRLPFADKENIGIVYNQVMNDIFFKLQEGLMDNITGDIQYINSELLNYANTLLSNTSEMIVIIITIGVLIFIIIGVFIFNSIYSEKIKNMNALVSFLFLVPQTILNENEKYKR